MYPKPSPCCNHVSQSLSFLWDGSVVHRMIESPKIRPNLQEPVMWLEKGLLQGQWYTLAHPAEAGGSQQVSAQPSLHHKSSAMESYTVRSCLKTVENNEFELMTNMLRKSEAS